MRYFLIIPLFFLFISCQSDEMIIGSRYIDENMRVLFTDTVSVNSYTVTWDSIQTSGYNTFLIGSATDSIMGNITSRSYVSMKLPEPGRLQTGSVFDSLQVILVPDGYYSGDTTQPFTITVNRLREIIDVDEGEALSSNTSLAYDMVPLGQVTFLPRPTVKDSVVINIDNTLALQLFNAFKNREDMISEQSNFELFLNGLVMNFSNSNKAIMGFKANDTIPVMRMYYHYFDFENQKKTIDFIMKDPDLQFNEISSSGPLVDVLRAEGKTDARQTDSLTYIQAGTGVFTRVEMPFIKNILDVTNNIEILKAELILEPARMTYTRKTLPTKISAYITNRYNELVYAIGDDESSVQTATLNMDDFFYEDTRYTFDITGFINQTIYEQTDNIPSLLITIQENDVFHTVDRIVLGSRWNRENQILLRIYYMTYE